MGLTGFGPGNIERLFDIHIAPGNGWGGGALIT